MEALFPGDRGVDKRTSVPKDLTISTEEFIELLCAEAREGEEVRRALMSFVQRRVLTFSLAMRAVLVVTTHLFPSTIEKESPYIEYFLSLTCDVFSQKARELFGDDTKQYVTGLNAWLQERRGQSN